MESLNLKYVNLDDIKSDVKNLTTVYCHGHYEGFPMVSNLSVTSPMFNFDDVNHVQLKQLSINAEKVKLNSRQKELQVLSIHSQGKCIRNIDELIPFKQLTELRLRRVGLEDTSGINLFQKLKTLDLEDNKLTDIVDIYNIDSLTELNITGNPVMKEINSCSLDDYISKFGTRSLNILKLMPDLCNETLVCETKKYIISPIKRCVTDNILDQQTA